MFMEFLTAQARPTFLAVPLVLDELLELELLGLLELLEPELFVPLEPEPLPFPEPPLLLLLLLLLLELPLLLLLEPPFPLLLLLLLLTRTWAFEPCWE